MSKKRIESYIPEAINVLSEEFKEGEIPSEYSGYISAFGVSIIQSGLKPTLALYENESAQTKSDKAVLTNLILNVLDANTKDKSLLKYVLSHKKPELKSQIIDIAVALKLAIRTFALKKEGSDA